MPTEIHQEVMFTAKPKEVYAAFMKSKNHTAFTKNGIAKISGKVGGAFSAHGGYITGLNLHLVENKHIVQARRAKNWPKGLYSIVSFKLEKEGTGTKLVFDHTGLPEKDVEHLAEGWKKMYWDKLTEYFA